MKTKDSKLSRNVLIEMERGLEDGFSSLQLMRGRMMPNESAVPGYSTATRTSTKPIVLEVVVLSFMRQKGLRPYSFNIRGTLSLLQGFF